MSATILSADVTHPAPGRDRRERMDARLGDRLVEAGAASRDDVERAAAIGQRTRRRLGEVLIEQGFAVERDVYQQLAKRNRLEFANVDDLLAVAEPQTVGVLSRRFQEYNHLVPISLRNGTLLVATSDPDGNLPQLAAAASAREVKLVVITPTDYRRLRLALDLEQSALGAASMNDTDAPHNLLSADHQPDEQIRELFQAILLDAIAERASDIHLEVYGDSVCVRIRVDGDLRDVGHLRLTPQQLVAVISLTKVRAKMDLAERRAPQGGRFTVHVGDLEYDVRAQTQPSLHGEHLVLRLLPQTAKVLSIADLGFPADLARVYRRVLDNPGGLILVVGPTGCGKSTTLYAGLQVLAQEVDRKVITVEDPIEYSIDRVQQCQVMPEVGFTFATAMRAFVREDPDVILVGEIRDGETALEALRASQTGHLVLSTLHCNDAVDAVQRLFDLGMHPNSIASELTAVFAQRLAKRICEGCRAEHTPDAALLAEVFPGGAPAGFRAFKGKGCSRCGGTGTYGRIAIVEHLAASPDVRRAIARHVSLDELRAAAFSAGYVPMRAHALDLVKTGLIALEELPDILTLERLGE